MRLLVEATTASSSELAPWLAWSLGVIGLWGLFCLVVAILNPAQLAERQYRFGERYFHIGNLRLGLWFYAKSPNQFRVGLGVIGVFLFVIGLVVVINTA
jgi:hypothetical protein